MAKKAKTEKKSAAIRRSRPLIPAGPGYRFVKLGETVVEGDEFYSPTLRKWCPALITVGEPLQASSVGHYRRKIGVGPCAPVTTTPGNSAIPGEGYRLIKVGETLVEGDQYYSRGRWIETGAAGEVLRTSDLPFHYRRKIEAEKAPEQPATTPAPAIGEGYRQLQPFEVVAEGDEMFSNLFGDPQWVPCRGTVGIKVSFFPDSTFRRKVETPATSPTTKVLPVDAVVTINLSNPERTVKCTRLEGGHINVEVGTVGQSTTSVKFGLSPEGAQALSIALSIISNAEVGQ